MKPSALARPSALLPVAIGAEQAIAHQGWHHARTAALAACRSGPGLVVILGEAGTGKSLLVQDLAWTLRGMGVSVLVPPAGDMALRDAAATRHQVVLIDDASADDAAALRHLQTLPQVIVLAVRTPAAEAAFGTPRIIRLQPLPADETGRFIAARLAQSGLSTAAFSAPATEHLAALSGGVPQRLNVLARQALLVAHAQRAPSIEVGHVLEAASLGGRAAALAAGPVAPAWVAEPVATAARPMAPTGYGASRQRPGTRTCLGVAACLVVIAVWLLISPGGRAPQDQPPPAQAAAATATPAVPEADGDGRAAVLQAPEHTAEATAEPAPSPEPEAAPTVEPQPGAAVPEAATTSTLPFGLVRVELRYRAGSAAEGRRAASLAALLHDKGFLVTERAVRAPAAAGLSGVRYYFAQDREAAAAIAQAAGLPDGSLQSDRAGTAAPPQPGLVLLTVAREGEPAARPIVTLSTRS